MAQNIYMGLCNCKCKRFNYVCVNDLHLHGITCCILAIDTYMHNISKYQYW